MIDKLEHTELKFGDVSKKINEVIDVLNGMTKPTGIQTPGCETCGVVEGCGNMSCVINNYSEWQPEQPKEPEKGCDTCGNIACYIPSHCIKNNHSGWQPKEETEEVIHEWKHPSKSDNLSIRALLEFKENLEEEIAELKVENKHLEVKVATLNESLLS